MSFVTLTDHDSIDGCLYLLDKRPDMTDFFIGEEVETYFPETGQRIHIGVWGLTEAQHREIQRLRRNIRELVPYLKSEHLVFGVNHLFQNYRMKNVAARYISEMLQMFDIYEVLNGAMASVHNKMVQDLVTAVKEQHGKQVSMVGGSDAHTLKHVAKVHTVSRGETTAEFLENIRAGNCFAWGSEMRFRELVADIYLLAYSGQDDIGVGVASAGRTRPEVKGLIGFFVNMLVVRAELSGEPSFSEYLARVQKQTREAYAHQDVPFAKLVEEIRPGFGGR